MCWLYLQHEHSTLPTPIAHRRIEEFFMAAAHYEIIVRPRPRSRCYHQWYVISLVITEKVAEEWELFFIWLIFIYEYSLLICVYKTWTRFSLALKKCLKESITHTQAWLVCVCKSTYSFHQQNNVPLGKYVVDIRAFVLYFETIRSSGIFNNNIGGEMARGLKYIF